MNNSDNNTNNQNNNEDLNAISLGNVNYESDKPNNIPTIDASSQTGGIPAPPPVAQQPISNPQPENMDSIPTPMDTTTSPTESLGADVPSDNGNNTLEAPVQPAPTMGNDSGLQTPTPTNLGEASQISNDVPPVAPLSYDVPETISGVSSMPSFNEIGTVPPIPDIPIQDPAIQVNKEKKSGGVSKFLFVIIIVLALAAVGVGVYIFLHLTSANASPITVKNVKIELGSQVSTNINDYATFKGIDGSSCQLDTREIPATIDKLGAEYTFKVTCGDKSASGKAVVVDTTKPEVLPKEVTAAVDSEVKPEDFIYECKDSTKCSYAFKDEAKVKEHLKTPANYHVDIVVKDEAGNETVVMGTLKVIEKLTSKIFEEADMYLVCTQGTTSLKMGINDDGNFNKSAMKTYVYKLSQEDFNNFKTESQGKDIVSYDDKVGSYELNETELTLTLNVVVDYDDLNKEEKTTLPLTTGDLRTYYTDKGYECSYGY